MKKNKMRLTHAIAGLAILILLISPVSAQLGSQSFPKANFTDKVSAEAELELAETSFSEPGLLPDNPFYFMKKFKENMQLLFSFDEKEKAKFHLKLAKTRLAEAKAMLGKNKTKEAESSIEEFKKEVDVSSENAEKNIPALHEEVQDVLKKSSVVLERALERADERAKPAIERVLNNSIEKSVRLEIKKERKGKEGNEVEKKIKEEIEKRKEAAERKRNKEREDKKGSEKREDKSGEKESEKKAEEELKDALQTAKETDKLNETISKSNSGRQDEEEETGKGGKGSGKVIEIASEKAENAEKSAGIGGAVSNAGNVLSSVMP